ncbi:MAG: cation:proton antiporter [Candidatus Porifericomitaceae bacterium WSBS_2022_MAG_OTU9]
MAIAIPLLVWLRRVGLPTMLGYIVIGLVLGQSGLAIIDPSIDLHLWVEIGLAFLLFSLGLEFSLPRLLTMGKPLLGMGGTQVLISTLSGTILAMLVGLEFIPAMVLGGAMALSSTAIGAGILAERMETRQQHGQLVIAILLFQDLAAIPLLVSIPILADSESSSLLLPLSMALIKGIIAVLLVLVASRRIVQPMLHMAARSHSSELFTMLALFSAMGTAWISHSLGLSYALGAFLAGVMLGGSEYKHQVESDIRPFRDVLMGLFFLNVGLQINIAEVLHHWLWLLLLVPGLILGKGGIIALLVIIAGHPLRVAIRTGMLLGQGSEFGLAVVILSLNEGIITQSGGQAVFAAIGISMLLSPLLIKYMPQLVERFAPEKKEAKQGGEILDSLKPDASDSSLHDHVLLCGYGHVGENLGYLLRAANIPFAALEMDVATVQRCRDQELNVYYGDARSIDLLRAGGLLRASALVISFNEPAAAIAIVEKARRIRLRMPIIVRISDEQNFADLEDAGATDIVPEYVEAGTTLATHLMGYLNVPPEKIIEIVELGRREQYQKLHRTRVQTGLSGRDQQSNWIRWSITIVPGSFAVGRKLGELPLPDDVRIYALRRGVVRNNAPEARTIIRTGDNLMMTGNETKSEECRRLLLWGN